MSEPNSTIPIPPVQVTMVDSGIRLAGASPLTDGTIATTPDHQPNLRVTVIGPIQAIAVRFAYAFLTALVGLLVAAMTPAGGKLLYTSDFFSLLLTCGSLALPGAALGLLKDLVTIFGRLEAKYPLATGNV